MWVSSAQVREQERRITSLEDQLEHTRGRLDSVNRRLQYADRRIAAIHRGLKRALDQGQFEILDRDLQEVERQIAESKEFQTDDQFFGRD